MTKRKRGQCWNCGKRRMLRPKSLTFKQLGTGKKTIFRFQLCKECRDEF